MSEDRGGFIGRFRALAATDPDALALWLDHQPMSRQTLLDEVGRAAAALRLLGVQPGDVVGLILPSGLRWATIFWGAVSLGAVPMPLDPQVGEWELAGLLPLASPTVVVATARFRANDIARSLEVLRPRVPTLRRVAILDEFPNKNTFFTKWEELLPEGPASLDEPPNPPREPLMLACTSGTTGAPRVMVVPHAGFLRSQLDMAAHLGLGPGDRMLLGMPLFHQGGLGMGLQALCAGGAAAYLPAFDPEAFLNAAATLGATALQLSPTLAKILLCVPDLDRFDLSRVRLAYFAGEALPDEVARSFWQKRNIRVINVIGSSETATMVIWDSDRDSACPPGDFRPLPFTDLRLVGQNGEAVAQGEPGELWVRTDAVITEYLANPAENASRIRLEGTRRWFATGDLCSRLPDGRVRFVGRAKRIIKRGANLVYPEEVEAFLLTHPDIAAVAVLKEPHELFGEAIVAHVQLAPGASLTRGDLLRFCRGKLAAYKVPDTLVVSDEIPAGIGKVQYKYLRGDPARSEDA